MSNVVLIKNSNYQLYEYIQTLLNSTIKDNSCHEPEICELEPDDCTTEPEPEPDVCTTEPEPEPDVCTTEPEPELDYTNIYWNKVGDSIFSEQRFDNIPSFNTNRHISLNGNGSIIAIGGPHNSPTTMLTKAGSVRIFEKLNNSWVQLGNDIDGSNPYDRFGTCVSLNSSGNKLAISAITENSGDISNTGSIRIYTFVDGAWTQLGNTIYGSYSNEKLGSSMRLTNDGNSLFTGTLNSSGHKAYVYSSVDMTWVQLGNDIILSGELLTNVSVDSNYNGTQVVISECYEDNGNARGTVTTLSYSQDSGMWNTTGQVIDTDIQGGLCTSMNSDGNIVAIGSMFFDTTDKQNIGRVKIFKYNNNSWTPLGSDIIGQNEYDYFGQSLALNANGNIVVATSVVNDNGFNLDSGSARVFLFDEDASGWTQMGTSIVGTSTDELLGISVDITADGHTIATNSFGMNNSSNTIQSGIGITKIFSMC